jgi:hypothetical protein
MELYIKDRIYFPQLLPQQGTFMEFNLKRTILKKVAITDAERETYNIQDDKDNNRITWDRNKDLSCPLAIDFTNDEMLLLRKGCEQFTEKDTPAPDEFWELIEKIYNGNIDG